MGSNLWFLGTSTYLTIVHSKGQVEVMHISILRISE